MIHEPIFGLNADFFAMSLDCDSGTNILRIYHEALTGMLFADRGQNKNTILFDRDLLISSSDKYLMNCFKLILTGPRYE